MQGFNQIPFVVSGFADISETLRLALCLLATSGAIQRSLSPELKADTITVKDELMADPMAANCVVMAK